MSNGVMTIARQTVRSVSFNVLNSSGPCFVWIRLVDNRAQHPYADTTYTLRGVRSGFTVEGRTDADGLLRHDLLPVDEYDLDVRGVTEPLETYFLEDEKEHHPEPWILALPRSTRVRPRG